MRLTLASPDFLEVFHKPHDKHMHLFSCFSFLAAVNQSQISATVRTVFCVGGRRDGDIKRCHQYNTLQLHLVIQVSQKSLILFILL